MAPPDRLAAYPGADGTRRVVIEQQPRQGAGGVLDPLGKLEEHHVGLHAVRHSALRIYWLNSWRVHPLESFVAMVTTTVPLLALGAPAEVLVLYFSFCDADL